MGSRSGYKKTVLLLASSFMLVGFAITTVEVGRKDDTFRCTSWQEAKSQCVTCENKCKLPIIRTYTEYKQTIDTMNENGIDAVWLGLQRRWLGDFFWLDCRRPSGPFRETKWNKNLNCAYLNTKSGSIKAAMCHENDRGVICQKRGCNRCSTLGFNSRDCVVINNVCYMRKNHDLNWETSRTFCSENGWEMAILSDTGLNRLLSNLSTAFADGSMEADQNIYWIGLRREEWIFLDSGPPMKSYWSSGEPRRRGNCSVIEKFQDDYMWRVVQCSSKYHALCLKTERIHKATNKYYRTIPTPVSFTRGGFPALDSPSVTSRNNTCICPQSDTSHIDLISHDAKVTGLTVTVVVLVGITIVQMIFTITLVWRGR